MVLLLFIVDIYNCADRSWLPDLLG